MAEQTTQATATPPVPKPGPTPAPKPQIGTPKTGREALEQERALNPVIAVAAHLAHNIDDAIPAIDPATGKDLTAKDPVTGRVFPIDPNTGKEILTPERQKIEDAKKAEREKAEAAKAEAKKKVDAEKKELYDKIGKILAEHHGNESEVPANNEYWVLVTRVRVLSNP